MSPLKIIRSHIGKRLFVAFGVIVALTIATAMASIYTFEKIQQAERRLIEHVQPDTRVAHAIRSGVSNVMSLLPQAVASKSPSVLEQIRRDLSGETRTIRKSLSDLPDLLALPGLLEGLNRDINPSTLPSIFELEIDRQISGRLMALQIAEQRSRAIQNSVSALQIISDDAPSGVDRTDLDIQRVVDDLNNRGLSGNDLKTDIRHLVSLNEIGVRSRSVIVTLRALDDAMTETAIGRFKSELVLHHRVLSGLTLRITDPALKARLASGVATIAEAMNGENGAIALSNRLVAAHRGVQLAYTENLETAAQLNRLSEAVLVSAKGLEEAAAANIRHIVRNGKMVDIGLAVFAIISALLILWLYVFRSVIYRLTVLTETTRALAGNDPHAIIPDLGNDEIGEVGTALNIFKKNAERVLEQEQALQTANQRLERINADLQSTQREAAIASQRLSDAVEAIPNGFLLWGADGTLSLVNDRYLALRPDMKDLIAGKPTYEEVARHSIAVRLPDATQEELETEFQRAIALHRLGSDRDQFQLPDGKWMQLEVRRTAEGGYVAVYTDVTEIVEARNQLSAAIKNMQSGFLLWDKGRRLVLCNERARELLPDRRDILTEGTPLQEFAHRTVLAMNSDAGEDSIRSATTLLLEKYQHPEGPFEALQPDGRWHQVFLQHTESGELVSVIIDITALKETQTSLEYKATELQRSNEELEQFAYLASHDLQEPLRVVASYCDLLSRRYADKFDDEGREFLAFAVDGAKRMRSLIDDLLTYSRVGRGNIEFETVSLSDAVGDAKTALWSQIEETGAVVDADDLADVAGSRQLITQVFQNLISNAIKFRSQETPHIQISATLENGFCKICIRDNGIGIDEKFIERVFRMFQRLHNREDYAGNGLGLALCQRVVHRHGGEIWVEPSTGVGTAVYFTLPTVRTSIETDKRNPNNGGRS